ncbi:PBP1b-binding outer membrane lipoprotein LpoB [Rossellomorea marisflavi]
MKSYSWMISAILAAMVVAGCGKEEKAQTEDKPEVKEEQKQKENQSEPVEAEDEETTSEESATAEQEEKVKKTRKPLLME